MSERRFPQPGLQRPAIGTRKPETALLRVARRYAETEAVRAIGAALAVAVVIIPAGLAWLWLFGN